ncbi:hypothetical protein IJT93_12910 [bacterium]|nr:hypothetical protein [bacterium]
MVRYINLAAEAVSWGCALLLAGELYLGCTGKIIVTERAVSAYFTASEREFKRWVGWDNRSEAVYRSEENPEAIMRIWPDGMRECRPEREKRTDFSAAFIGCSCTFGEGVRAEETEVWRLNERYPEVTFDNWGVCGWGPVQMYGRMTYLLNRQDCNYKLVVYNLLDDHKFRNYKRRALGQLRFNGYYVCCPYGNFDLFNRFRLYYMDDLAWPGEKNLLTVDFAKRIYYSYCTDVFQRRYERDVCKGRDLQNADDCYFEIVRKMKKLCDEHGVDFLVCNIQPFDLNRSVLTDGRFKDIEYINVDIPNSSRPEYRVLGDVLNHPNGVVHAYWADRFADWFDGRYGDYLQSK